MLNIVLRVILGVFGCLFSFMAIRIWLDPVAAMTPLGMHEVTLPLGLATMRADMGALFAVGGVCALLGAWRAQGRLLTPALALMTVALFGRLVALAFVPFDPSMIQPMVAEAIAVIVLAFARKRLGA